MNLYIIGISILIFIIFLYYIFLKYIENKINNLEEKIKKLFLERSNLIPGVYEVSSDFLNRHNEIFYEILNLRKLEFSQDSNNLELSEIIETKKLIHHEINFIFKVSNKHNKMIKEGKFIYLRQLIIKKSAKIGENIEKYRLAIKYINKLIFYKNITVIGLLFPIRKKIEI